MDRVLFVFADIAVTPALVLTIGGGLVGLALLVALVLGDRRRKAAAAEAERRLADLMRLQSEMTGRMQAMAELFGARTADLARLVDDRLDREGRRMGDTLRETSQRTEESLTRLNERLAVIDRAQSSMAALSGEIVSLQSILANKQTRGAFGQGRMEAIVGDALPPGAYRLQATLSNGTRPDCVVHMPNGAPPLVIDAKFPLESWQRFSAATEPEARRQAQSAFRGDMGVHIRAVAEKYLIAGETQDTAFLFVPSESIFADLNERFEDVVQRAARARVVIVSPTLLMLSIQVVQALLRDVRMREEAHRIQKEVAELIADIGRLEERTRKLQGHFQQAGNDVADILVSTGKVLRRSERIEAMEFDEAPAQRLAGEQAITLP